jgi:hypothetical protein
MSNKTLLREFFELCPDGVCEDILTESDKRFIKDGGTIMSGVIQRAGTKNQNNRVYSESILRREMDKYNVLVQERRALGELDHPDQSVINLRNVSHLVTEIWWKGNDVMGKIQVLNTPSGQVLKELVNAGVKVGISSRGTGSVRESREGTIVEDDFNLICFDMVSEPSTHGAFMMQENKKHLVEGREARINDLINNILKKGNK